MRDRTADLLRARQALSQLSYSPRYQVVGLGRFELPTSPLSGVRSNQLSYRPAKYARKRARDTVASTVSNEDKCVSTHQSALRIVKEVIQPQVPLGLPCYDFTPVMNHSVVIALRERLG